MMLFASVCFTTWAQTPAFPGAEGYARTTTTGGRGGSVYHVTNLNDAGTGSLRGGISLSGKRTIVFDVSGTIELLSELKISKGDVTIAGQTAPGDGICLKNYNVTVAASNVILRFIRCRLGVDKPDANGTIDRDAMWGREQANIIIDHCTMSWCTDECGSFYDNKNFTMQWCLLAESLKGSLHPKGYHGYGGIWGGKGASFHHNLLAHHDSRNPRLCGSRYSNDPSEEKVDLRNNVIYNWGATNSAYAGEGGSYNFVNNYYKSGPATKESIKYRIFQPGADDGSNNQPKGIYGTFYLSGNYMNEKGANWDWNGINIDSRNNADMTVDKIKSTTEYDYAAVTTHSAETAFNKVLLYAGASLHRDSQDTRIVEEARNGTYTYVGSKLGGLGIIDNPNDVGGWPALATGTAPTDTDSDGIPDSWESANGLNPNDKSDGATLYKDGSGYTNLEVYINSLVEQIVKDENADADIIINETFPVYSLPTDIPTTKNTPSTISIQKNGSKKIIKGLEDKTHIEVYSLTGLLTQNFHTTDRSVEIEIVQPSILKVIGEKKTTVFKIVL